MYKPFLRTASLLGALAVALGAFGAHALKSRVSDIAANTFETGVRYHFYHVLALTMLGILYKEFKNKWILISGNLFILGIVLFSGSLYALTFTVATARTDFNWIGVITPFGGLSFVAGWFSLLLGVTKKTELRK
jgi:uncharacterized membrane protein YgdD (TMEM256/DUF423 family)